MLVRKFRRIHHPENIFLSTIPIFFEIQKSGSAEFPDLAKVCNKPNLFLLLAALMSERKIVSANHLDSQFPS